MTTSRFFARLAVFAVSLASTVFSTAAAAPDYSGTYKLIVTNRNGETQEMTLNLAQSEKSLTGKLITAQGNSIPVESGKLNDDGSIGFVTRLERDGNSLEMKSRARLEGDELQGRTEYTTGSGEVQERKWLARKVVDLTGRWKSTIRRQDGTPMESELELRQNGEKLSGSSTSRGGTRLEISDGKVQKDEVSFRMSREREGRTITSRYRGKFDKGIIKGHVESDWSGEFRKLDWEAASVK